MARPKLKNEKDRKVPLNATVTKGDIRFLKNLGNGNISQGIRLLIEMFVNLQK